MIANFLQLTACNSIVEHNNLQLDQRREFRICSVRGYDQRDATNALKRFLIGQFVKFFLLNWSIKCFKL